MNVSDMQTFERDQGIHGRITQNQVAAQRL